MLITQRSVLSFSPSSWPEYKTDQNNKASIQLDYYNSLYCFKGIFQQTLLKCHLKTTDGNEIIGLIEHLEKCKSLHLSGMFNHLYLITLRSTQLLREVLITIARWSGITGKSLEGNVASQSVSADVGSLSSPSSSTQQESTLTYFSLAKSVSAEFLSNAVHTSRVELCMVFIFLCARSMLTNLGRTDMIHEEVQIRYLRQSREQELVPICTFKSQMNHCAEHLLSYCYMLMLLMPQSESSL